jgi:plasmid stability protein
MPDVLVRGVDETTLLKLKARARGNGHSLGVELRMILEQAAQRMDMASARAAAEEMTRRLAGRRNGDSGKLLREDRQR